MEPTTRRGFLRVTAVSAAVVTASIGLRGLVEKKVAWVDPVGGPDCPQSLYVERLGAEALGRYRVKLLVETPWESLEYRLEDALIERGKTQINVPLVYPYTTYQPGRYSYRVRLESEEMTVETSDSAYFELSSYRWFV